MIITWKMDEREADRALAALRTIPDDEFDRYSNPFEQKWTLREKWGMPDELEKLIASFEAPETRKQCQRAFNYKPLEKDGHRHYCGVFRYDPGDHLSVHVDAGIHPINGLRKAITIVCYLGDGTAPLEFWSGNSCTDESPFVSSLSATIAPQHGRVIIFDNWNEAWHGVPPETRLNRYVVTVSLLGYQDTRAMNNPRTRAYFVPRPDEIWTPEMIALRDKRASEEQHAEVYRA